MHPVRTIGVLLLVLTASCAGIKAAPPVIVAPTVPPAVAPTADGPSDGTTVAAEPPRSEAKQETGVSMAPPAATRQPPVIGKEAATIEAPAAVPADVPADVPAAHSKIQSDAKAAPPAHTSAKPAAAPIGSEQPSKHEDLAAVAGKAEPPLDMAALKTRLRETRAIGVFTKLALQNQVDDLLKQFRAHYLSGQKTSVAALRQPFDMLILKVLALLQDSDPSLAKTISGSREAIWGILADPVKFNAAS